MTREYLMIENRGLVGTKLLTVVGASTARGESSLIGQFGSGFKFSIALLLRHEIDVKLFIGKQGYEFGVDTEDTKDVRDRDVEINEVFMKGISGPSKAKTRLGFDLGFGEIDWDDPTMACREFMSNAADASMTLQGDYKACTILYKTEEEVKPTDGHTRVFIELTPEIRAWDLKKYFMIFDKDYDPSEKIITKRVPNSGLRVYRKGVLVGETGNRSLWDYNLPDIPLKESRIITTEDARTHIAYALKDAPQDILETWLTAVRDARDVFEVDGLSTYALKHNAYDDGSKERLDRWTAAFRSVFSDAGVLCDNTYASEGVRRKGYAPVVVAPAMRRVLESFELPTSATVLDHFEAKGLSKVDLTPEQHAKMVLVWEALVEMGVTKDRLIPAIEGFSTVMDAGGTTFAYYDPTRDTVGMSRDFLTDGGFTFIKAAIEEYAHAITGARDETRDLQDWAFRVAAILLDRVLKTQ